MKITRPSLSIIEQDLGVEGIYKQIELAGRTCYKSEDKITETSAKSFVERMIASKHYAMLEHGTVYLSIPDTWNEEQNIGRKLSQNKYSKFYYHDCTWYITTNLRVLVENELMDALKYVCAPIQYHYKRVTVLFHTQIAISREFNRHRVNSMAESSTRYCNYSKDKFDNEINVNLPTWVNADDITKDKVSDTSIKAMLLSLSNEFGYAINFQDDLSDLDYWLIANVVAEHCYMKLIEKGWKAQQARTILPLDTHTDLVHTAFVDDWKHFIDLRAIGTTGKPHPDAEILANSLYNEFKKHNLV